MDQYFCALCGGPFESHLNRTKAEPGDSDVQAPTAQGLADSDTEELTHYYDGAKISREEMQWLKHLRVIARYEEEPEEAYPEGMLVRDGFWISGIGVECSLNEATVQYLYEDVLPEQYEDWDDEKTVTRTVYGNPGEVTPQEEWCYPVHDACLHILQAALTYQENSTGIARIPWNIIHHIFGLHRESDIGCLAVLLLDYKHKCIDQYWTVNRGDEYVSDPINIRGLQNLLAHPPSPIHASSSLISSAHNNSSDPFSRLSIDVLFHLSTYLPNPTYAALCLASRAVASLRLVSWQSFWRSRIIWMPHVLEQDLTSLQSGVGDWREVCRMLGGEVEGVLGECLGWQNRRRIWEICMGLVNEAARLVKEGVVIGNDGDNEEEYEEVEEEEGQ